MKRLNVPAFVTIALAAVFSLRASAENVTIGQPAPALTFTELLQAQPGAQIDWPSLRGKVVVLEFWATWCSACVEEIPHLNSLVRSLQVASKSANIQFIAVDDEDSGIVKKFLAKMPIDGWVGLDTSKKTIDAYDAQNRPRTFVIDTQGRIAATLRPEQLNREQLLALAGGEPVVFPNDKNSALSGSINEAKAAAQLETAGTAASRPLFDISIRSGDPNGQMVIIENPGENGGSYSLDVRNAPLLDILPIALSTTSNRLEIHGGAQNTRYTLHVNAPRGNLEQLAPALELAFAAAAGMKVSHAPTEQDAYVLQATPQAVSLLAPSTSKKGGMCFYESKSRKFMMMKSTLDDLAQTLEESLGTPVVNETGLPGEFDAIFDLSAVDKEAATAALKKNLGLTLTTARRKIDRIIVDLTPIPAKVADDLPQTEPPAPSTEKPGQPTQESAQKP